MSYFRTITIPKSTTQANPYISLIKIAPLVLNKVEIVQPSGCIFLVGTKIYYRSGQLYPYNDDGWFLGNGYPITFNPGTELLEPPHEIEIRAYNLDDFYDHTITIMIDVTFIKTQKQPTLPEVAQSLFGNIFTVRRGQ